MKREVLLIEDDVIYRTSVVLLFDEEQYNFVEAGSPEEGIKTIEANPQIRVILLDLSFGHAKGTAVLDYIKLRADVYRVIVLTAHDELLLARQADKYSVFCYLPKAERSAFEAIQFSVDQAFKDLERVHLDRKLGYMFRVQNRINDNVARKETLDLICESVRSLVGAYTCHIRVYDVAYGDYRLEGFAGVRQMRRAFERPKAKGEFFSGLVIRTGVPMWYDDLQQQSNFQHFAQDALGRPGVPEEEKRYYRTVRSAYIAPIKTGLHERPVDAVLNVSSDEPAFYTEERRALVDEFVAQASLAITKDWLQRKRGEIHQDYELIGKVLNGMGDRIRGTHVLKGICESVTHDLAEIISAEIVSIFLYDETSGLLENFAEFRGGEHVSHPPETYAPGQSLTGSVYEEGVTIQRPDPDDATHLGVLHDKRYDALAGEGQTRPIPFGEINHFLGVPIKIGGRVRGVLRAINKKSKYYDDAVEKEGISNANLDRRCLLERGFSIDCRHVLEITASHLAVAIRNAQLLREKDRQVEQVRTLSEVGRLLSSEMRIDAVLELTMKKMSELMKAEICMMFLKDEQDDNRIVLKQCFGMPIIPEAFYALGEGVTGGVAASGTAVLKSNADENDGKYDSTISKYLFAGEIESLMIAPIKAKGRVLGVIKVINKAGDHLQYGMRDLKLFETFADYVAVALWNANIHKLANDELVVQKRNAALSFLVSAVAHEINNTSGLIPANVAGIKALLGGVDDKVERMLNLIERVAKQATDFATELAGFSAAQRGDKQKLDVNQIIRSSVEELQSIPRFENSGNVRLEVSLGEEPLLCEIFESPFVQIVRNITINAFQALDGKEGGVVCISTREEPNESTGAAVIRFEDNGPGIRPEYREKIFEPDFTTKRNGNGLGLWLVRTQLEPLGGTISVESEPGRGATFVVTIPLAVNGGMTPDEAADASSTR